jgi:hypothetical protein
VEWRLAAALAGITWLEGVRQTPPGALVLRCRLNGVWTASGAVEISHRWRLVAWWPPFTVPLVLCRAPSERGILACDGESLALSQSLRAVRWHIPAARLLGGAELVLLVLVLPFATGAYGPAGFVGTLAVVLALCTAITAMTWSGIRRLDAGRSDCLVGAATTMWPFSAGRAPELLITAATRGIALPVVARHLLAADEYKQWLRPHAYDALVRRGVELTETASQLIALLGEETLQAAVDGAPPNHDARHAYCPRCGAAYLDQDMTCKPCGEIPLVREPLHR